MNAIDVALICKALGDANRLEIVKMLSDGEKCVLDHTKNRRSRSVLPRPESDVR